IESGTDLRHVVAFPTAALALDAALAIHHAVESSDLELSLRAAVHEGACIALTRGGKVDWFGDTVTRGAALLDETEEGGVAMSLRVADQREVLAIALASGRVSDVRPGASPGYRARRVMRLLPKRS